jgi:hypothetical protein
MNLELLHGDVAVTAPGVARFAADEAIHQSAVEFFRDSRAWRVDLDPEIELLPGELEYELGIPFGTKLVEPITLKADEIPLRSNTWIVGEDPMMGSPKIRFLVEPPGRLVTGDLAVTLNATNRQIPDRLGDAFREAIVHGALARLLRTPQTQFTNFELSMLHGGLYAEMKERAATYAENGYKHKRTRTVQYGGY